MKKVISFVLLTVYLSFTVGTLSGFQSSGDHLCADVNETEAYSLLEKSGKHCADLHLDALGFSHGAKHIASAGKLKVPGLNSISLAPVSFTNAVNAHLYFIKPSALFYRSSIYLRNRVLLL